MLREYFKRILNNNKAFFFSLDALLAVFLIGTAFFLIGNFYSYKEPTTITYQKSNDVANLINTITYNELISIVNNSERDYLINLNNSGLISNDNNDLLYVIASLWAQNNIFEARNITKIFFNKIKSLCPNIELSLMLGNETIYSTKEIINQSNIVSSQRLIAGIAKGAPIEGSTASAYIKKIKSKENFVITYFGGFIGQGNISLLSFLPDNINITNVILKIDIVSDFDLYINNNYCTRLISNNNLTKPQSFNITNCKSFFKEKNNITLISLGNINDAYVAGGFLKVSYKTNVFQENNLLKTRYYFPLIRGIINIYDSFYAPGFIKNYTINITFKNNYTTFLRIGNDTIFSLSGKPYYQNVFLTKNNLNLTPTTIPIRLGTTNFSNVTYVTEGKSADTILVTDVSGSMGDCGESYEGEVCKYDCVWWWFSYTKSCPYEGSCSNEECGSCANGYTDTNYRVETETICNRTKLEIAQDADKTAVNIILNKSGNQVGTVAYSSYVKSTQDLTDDKNLLYSEIDSYYANGGTCICCGINKARLMLENSKNKKFIIVLSDGDANYRCDNFDDTSGTYDTANAAQSTIDAGQYACSQNITVFTIGFGDAMSNNGREILKETACNESLYYDASNVSSLTEIYKNISNQILLIANFSSQTVTISGNLILSNLNYSYIDFFYDPLPESPYKNEIAITKESPYFNNCSLDFYIPEQLRVIDAFVTSYSGPYWTSLLKINGNTIFNLSDYSTNYLGLGDPFIINIPYSFIKPGANHLTMQIEDKEHKIKNCSNNNSLIYFGLVNNSIPRSSVLEKAEGCFWTIEFEDNSNISLKIPFYYSGSQNCFYTNSSHNLNDTNDAYDYAVFYLLKNLDFDNDGRVFVNLEKEDLEIIVNLVGKVPYLWGPSVAKIILSKE